MSTRRNSLLCALIIATSLVGQRPAIPTPADVFGFVPGTEGKLADADQILEWFRRLAAASDRVRLEILGTTTLGNPFPLAIITSPANHARLEEIRRDNLRLADPRTLAEDAAAGLVSRGKTIVLLNASIHANEVGPTQSTPGIAWFLATTQDPAWKKVLEDVVLLLNPCHNPDGCNLQTHWYRKWVGTPFDAAPLPRVYNAYVGHDNNRDWFMFTQVETRLTVQNIHAQWRPQIVLDQHQMGTAGARMFIPPYQEPIEPNIDPILIRQIASLGGFMKSTMEAKGLGGIVSNSLFDAWTPARAYQHYHGGVRILTEIASCRVATTIDLRKGSPPRGPRSSGEGPASQPALPATWSLSDIMKYNSEGAFAALRHASDHRQDWLRNFHQVFQNACNTTSGPRAFVIPPDATRAEALMKLTDILSLGGLEGFLTQSPLVVSGSTAPAGSLVIPAGQPFFPFARALLENTPYPEVRDRPDGPIRRPYDNTAHCLPLLMNVRVLAADGAIVPPGGTKALSPPPPPAGMSEAADAAAAAFAAAPRRSVAVYRSFNASMDEGWTRYFLDSHNLPFDSLDNGAMARLNASGTGAASRRTSNRVLVLPDESADAIESGLRGPSIPPDFRGGIGEAGTAAIGDFVRAGGTLVCVKDSCALAIRLFRLPLKNGLADPEQRPRVNIPGALLGLDLDPAHALAAGMPGRVAAFFEGGKAWDVVGPSAGGTGPAARVVARWAPAAELRLAGYAEGQERVGGKAAVVEFTVGKGRVILFGFSPIYRSQTHATFPLFLNVLRTT